ncbi:GNAT family N-acetyltransferase [Falsiroseomonas sp.]|uniref:GNAT family N-acetyltransferase n=1 Tax=Falsiroseomonas sp. TaxID=2870721 RepID=UPI003F702B50
MVGDDVYIAGIFVLDEHQGGGVCRAVLTALLRIADRERLPVSLEVKPSTGEWLEAVHGRRRFHRTGAFGQVGPKMRRWPQPVISSPAVSPERSGNTCTT